MKIEDQVTNLELSKKLKELEVPQNSSFYWRKYSLTKEPCLYFLGDIKVLDKNKVGLAVLSGKLEFEYSAFSVAELGEMLPKELYIPYKGNSGKKRKYPQYPHCFFGGEEYFLVNYTGGNSREFLTQQGDTEANARAQMLVYLIEHKLLDPKKI